MSEQDNEKLTIRHEVVFWRGRNAGQVTFGVECESNVHDTKGRVGCLRYHLFARQHLRSYDDLRPEELA